MKTVIVCCLLLAVGLLQGPAQPPVPRPPVIRAQVLQTNWSGELLTGVERPEDFLPWLAGMKAYRTEMQKMLQAEYPSTTSPYDNRALQWARRSFIQPQMMAHERYFYDPVARRYTVERYLHDLDERYGGIDSVLIWPTYPNIGIDDRNQFDLWRDMPGGLKGLRGMVSDFHQHGVRVLMPIMIWDQGTRDEGVPMPEGLTRLAKAIGADGFNGDTMSPVTREFYTEALKLGHPMALEPEVGMGKQLGALAWNVLSWGYWWPYQQLPGVDRYKWIEPRHLTHVCDRWAHDRTDMLQYAFFNGDGYESWENIWGIWNPVSPRDAEALRRIAAIYRAVPELLSSSGYEPFTPTLQPGVYATRFPQGRVTLWTIINRAPLLRSGPQMHVLSPAGTRFYDLWHGAELKPPIEANQATLSFELEARGYGAILACAGAPPHMVSRLLESIRQRTNVRLADLSSQWTALAQQIVEVPRTGFLAHPPEGMVLIPGGRFEFKAEGVMIEKSDGVDFQYPWEDAPQLKHQHTLILQPFYIDRTPVTCAEFKRFLDASHYRPKDDHNFLRPWVKGSFPPGWANKPVTWVSLEDARAFARWAGKRLPHEWEWQYAAQGTDGRPYPWGRDKDASRLPPFETGRRERPPTDVDAFPRGASPFGVIDLVGNVWQWTDEYHDEHTRAAVLKGGSYYRPDKSMWYFPQARRLDQHGKYLLLAPSIDRSATIGFRCVTEAK